MLLLILLYELCYRTGQTTTLLPASPGNRFGAMLFVIGGYNKEVGYLADTWSWRIDVPGEHWRQDFTNKELFGSGDDSSFVMNENPPFGIFILFELLLLC